MKYIRILILVLIIVLGGFLRFYKLDQAPPSLNWDEIAAGYNAYTIANWGADEYGNRFPIVFKSFGDDKHPVHIYLTALVVKIFGLSDYSTRTSSAFVGTLSILAIYFLAKKLFKSEAAGLVSALFLAVSPYHLHFSRGLWEANFALFFLLSGLALFYYGIEKKNLLIPLSFFSFGLSFFSYHSAKIIVPPVVILLCLFNLKNLVKNKKMLLFSLLVVTFFGALVIKEPGILGFARINQTRMSAETIEKYGGIWPTYFNNYKSHFTYSYLFQNGDQGPRASVKGIGEFYKIDLVLGIVGILMALFTKKWKTLLILLVWLFLSPVPGALSSTEPSAIRGIFMIGPVLLLAAWGAASIIGLLKKNLLKVVGVILLVALLVVEVKDYLNIYYNDYTKNEAIEWQYGMREVVEYLRDNPDYLRVYVDPVRQQPYIFFLYYFKTPLPEFLKTVKYDKSQANSSNTVLSFDRYQFGSWNIINSYPNYKVLYVVTPSYYTGLRYGHLFNLKKLVKYPNGNDAFYIVGGDLK